jgi:hypothetical protein
VNVSGSDRPRAAILGGRIMLSLVLAVILGFAAGYGTREWISRRHRAAAREAHFRKQQEKRNRDY